MNVAIVPTQEELLEDKLFDVKNARDDALERFRFLKEGLESEGYRCHTIDKFKFWEIDVLIFSRLDKQLKWVLRVVKENSKVRLIYTANEPSIICPLHNPSLLSKLPLDVILTWNDDAVSKADHIQKANIGQPEISLSDLPEIPFERKKLCCMVASGKQSGKWNELYSERLNAIRFFSAHGYDFDLFGVGWGKSTDPLVNAVYRGKVDSKRDVMKNYKFSICYENVKDEKGLITEKIFDSFGARCVPIYRGASNIRDYIPYGCYVDAREFHSYTALYDYIANMGEERYEQYLRSAERFIDSDQYSLFTSKNYVRNVKKAICKGKDWGRDKKILKFKWTLLKVLVKEFFVWAYDVKRLKRFFYELIVVW